MLIIFQWKFSHVQIWCQWWTVIMDMDGTNFHYKTKQKMYIENEFMAIQALRLRVWVSCLQWKIEFLSVKIMSLLLIAVLKMTLTLFSIFFFSSFNYCLGLNEYACNVLRLFWPGINTINFINALIWWSTWLDDLRKLEKEIFKIVPINVHIVFSAIFISWWV